MLSYRWVTKYNDENLSVMWAEFTQSVKANQLVEGTVWRQGAFIPITPEKR
jgi:hypothetical protein